ncbi:transcriptional regulator [Actinoalloteichus sp. AHMU CJ021]|uniref:winged helix-turn-helix transcriptional regulator n=1 Tax=Actinoalloteichus TaxID=65496 RepID=UPI00037EB19D|nr:helix-turn-helix domain-containing protein [Actinoalloteichus spitiensis]AUS77096.1 transcriptional regulator [Actinoalloteichus sp. AHMU CJ021]
MRTYGDACGITRALDAVGERWALPVVRELVFGPRRYSDLAAALPGVSTNILGTRLRELAEVGVVVRRRLPPPTPVAVYELTAWGRALEPVLIALGRWAAHTPVDLAAQVLSPSSFALALRTTFDASLAAGRTVAVRLEMGEDVFDARIEEGAFHIARAAPDSRPPAVRVAAPPAVLSDLTFGSLSVEAAERRQLAVVSGPHADVESLLSCFVLPDPPPEEGHS